MNDLWEGTNLYQRIAEEIRMKIVDGVYRPGDRLPSIRDLTRQGSAPRARSNMLIGTLPSRGW
jgi:DNA-binding GntR family transcriptional regulator